MPITIPQGVEVNVAPGGVIVKGPKGSLSQKFNPDMKITRENGVVKVDRPSDERHHKALHGLTRSLLANMVVGVSEGYERTLEMVGVGYRAQQNGQGITLSVMKSHSVEIESVEGVELEVEGTTLIHVRGIDKQLVGRIAADIRKARPPNAYTGKGVRYRGETIKLKPGKSARRV
jgi:large subunit ribosomal protein L6